MKKHSASPKSPPRASQAPALDYDQSEFNVIFIHSRLDDYGLSPAQFRVYSHLARRAGNNGAYPKVDNIARVCKLHVNTVRKVLNFLKEHGFVNCKVRPSETSVYTLTKPSQWRPPMHVREHSQTEPGQPSQTDTLPNEYGIGLVGQPSQTEQGRPSQSDTGRPSQSDTPEGYPLEGIPPEENPKKVIHTLSEESERPVSSSNSIKIKEEAAAVLAVYPEPVRTGGKIALQAITAALKEVPFEKLIEMVKQFAKAWEGASPGEIRFCPRPVKFFGNALYNDPPTAWGPAAPPAGASTARLGSIPQQKKMAEARAAELKFKIADMDLDPDDEESFDTKMMLKRELQNVRALITNLGKQAVRESSAAFLK